MKYEDFLAEIEQDPEYIQAKNALRLNFALGDAVIHARYQRGWSQSELARLVGTKQANISRIESGLANPTLQLIKKIIDVLELDVQFVHRAMFSTTTTLTIDVPREKNPPIPVSWLITKSKAEPNILQAVWSA